MFNCSHCAKSLDLKGVASHTCVNSLTPDWVVFTIYDRFSRLEAFDHVHVPTGDCTRCIEKTARYIGSWFVGGNFIPVTEGAAKLSVTRVREQLKEKADESQHRYPATRLP